MTQDEIIELARQAGFSIANAIVTGGTTDIRRFAKLVAAKEREKWFEVEAYLVAACDGSMSRNNSEQLAAELLDTIRARGEA